MALAFLNIGTQEMILIVIVILLLFGGKKLPELARGLGRGIREFKDASDGIKREISDQINSFEKNLDVTVEDKAPVYNSNDTTVEPVSVENVEEQIATATDEAVQEKKFPNFSAPENTYQHNPGGHPADDSEYYKYGYNDHFADETDKTVENSENIEPDAATAKPSDTKQA
ncbi:Sec-independent protein translocase subunit TatA/TatB [Sphingobacterium rhinopitheci]|uniref:Sec-independent protein translocase subunit TatA/TatB n=1 Tax=Sphingobacterium rhinopitheci TaxID=2781960 RepID=UPI00293F0F61|nr:twin-arginine translocase TatA/TatE family subunit [Sphingobacterium rhinopitheci]MCI0920780.1 twin-arginine translocase TatA/TatE family subunit [Sphingobacterium rhinopitheci]